MPASMAGERREKSATRPSPLRRGNVESLSSGTRDGGTRRQAAASRATAISAAPAAFNTSLA